MTPNMKLKHAIEVLKELEHRYDGTGGGHECVYLKNLVDLRDLLEKPHKTEKESAGVKLSDDSMQLAHRLWELITARKSNFRFPNLVNWALDMDKILRLDKRASEDVADVIDWCQQDDFWQDNILSPAKLRKQLDHLELKMSRDARWLRNRLLTEEKTGPSAKEKYLQGLGESIGRV